MNFFDATVVTVQFLCAGVNREAGCLEITPRRKRATRIFEASTPFQNPPGHDFSSLLEDMTKDGWQITSVEHRLRKIRGAENSGITFCLRRLDASAVFDDDYLGTMRFVFQMLRHQSDWQASAYKYNTQSDADDGSKADQGLHLVFKETLV